MSNFTHLEDVGRVKLFYSNFHPLEVVSRYRDPQLKVTSICLIWDQTFANLDV